ncbi:DUF4126 domain-containing protein [Novosphingobium panipatense]
MASSVSLLSGWRLYLCVFATGLAMKAGWIAMPEHLGGLAVLASPWVLGASGLGLAAEFLADKIAWVDSVWDGVHTFIRPVGGALLALTIVDPADPAWQIVGLLPGGSAALLAHGAKAGTRAVVNTSPEPVSNVAVSLTEDTVTGTMLVLAFANPVVATIIAVFLTVTAVAVLLVLRRLLRRMRPARAATNRFHMEPPANGGVS